MNNRQLPSWLYDWQTEFEATLSALQHYYQNKITTHRKYAAIGLEHLQNAMSYSLCLGGKRLRPLLVFAAAEATHAKGHFSTQNAAFAALSIEMIHTYSLIHDDLPAMDDDDMRRGKPSCHVQFDEATAILAGDTLLTEALHLLTLPDNLSSDLAPIQKPSPETILRLIQILSKNSGLFGMAGGQMVDLQGNAKSTEDLASLHQLKTGALLSAACEMGAVIGSPEDKVSQEILRNFGEKLGLAFQIQDDILDVTGTEATLGKPVGTDARQDRCTYVSLHGIEGAQALARETADQAFTLLDSLPGDREKLRFFVEFTVTRNK